MFLSCFLFHWIELPAKGCWVVIYSLKETVPQVMLCYSSISLPAPFMLFQTVPKLSPKLIQSYYSSQVFGSFYSKYTWSKVRFLRLWFPLSFAGPQPAVCDTSRAEKNQRYFWNWCPLCLKMWSLAPNFTPLKMSAIKKSVSVYTAPSNQPHIYLYI